MKSNTLFAILVGTATAGFIAWRVCVVLTALPPQYEVVEDHSGSHGPTCESLKGLAAQVLGSANSGSPSALAVLLLGDRSTANEPRRIGTYPIPTLHRVAETNGELAREREGILADIVQQCQTVPQTHISPIFLGVAQGVADLRARGCSMRSHCTLFVDSDLQENVERSIKDRLNGPHTHVPALPPPIDNAGIGITFCGYAVTAGRHVSPSGRKIGSVSPRDEAQEARLKETWRNLFTVPDAVTFEPFCPALPGT